MLHRILKATVTLEHIFEQLIKPDLVHFSSEPLIWQKDTAYHLFLFLSAVFTHIILNPKFSEAHMKPS